MPPTVALGMPGLGNKGNVDTSFDSRSAYQYYICLQEKRTLPSKFRMDSPAIRLLSSCGNADRTNYKRILKGTLPPSEATCPPPPSPLSTFDEGMTRLD